MIPLWGLADDLRQKSVRQVSKEIIATRYQNEPIGMVGIRKPSVHFYTKQLITYELNDPISLVNLSERLRYEERGTSAQGKNKSVNKLIKIDGNYAALLSNKLAA